MNSKGLENEVAWYPNKATMLLRICGKLECPYISELHKCKFEGIAKLYDAVTRPQNDSNKKD